MVKKYRVELDRDACIGVATCVAIIPDELSMADDNKVDVRDSMQDQKTKFFVREISENELKTWIEAAEVCPVNVIHITDLETGKRLI